MIRALLCLLLLTVSAAFGISIENRSELPDGRVGSPYLEQLSVDKGRPPYIFEITDGSLPPGLTLVPSIGTIVGLPTAAGEYEFRIRVRDSRDDSDTKRFRLNIAGIISAPAITTASLPSGTAGTPYAQSLSASGGLPPYRWSAAGTLPPGINLTPSGDLSGTPSSAGTFDFTAEVRDARNVTGAKPLRIVINAPAPVISTQGLASGTVGQTYSQTLAASGGAPPYSWTVAGGALPPGLGLSTTGAITGTPGSAGDFDFTASVRDSAGASATKALRIVVAAAPITITTSDLPRGTAGQPYAAILQASGGTPPYAWTVASGTLPGGLALSPSGNISGTPSASGTFDFSVRANDSAPKALRIIIGAAEPPPVTVSSSAMPPATAGQAYSTTLTATGGTPPYAWTLAGGALPPGLVLAPSGTISGTPTGTGGDFDFNVRATDAADRSGNKALRISVAPAPAAPVTITSAGLASGTVGQPYSQTLTANGGTAPYNWSVASGALPGGLSLNAAGLLAGTPNAAGDFSFTVQATDTANRSGTRALRIVIAAAAAPLTVGAGALPPATAGQSYSQSLSATGGRPPYNWALASGALPPGLSVSASGTIAGVPGTPGEFDFTVRVRDSASGSADRAFRITVAPGETPLNITTSSVPGGSTGVAYAQPINASGGRGPYSWSVVAGNVPPGLRLDGPSGQLAGTPLVSGVYSFTARVADSAGRTAERAFNLQIAGGLAISACPVAVARTGAPYTANATATGGTPPYQWAVASGQLPAGVALSPLSGALAGTPTAAGLFSFVLAVTDAGNATASLSCTINAGTSLEIVTSILPDATTLASYSHTLQGAGGVAPYRWTTSAGSLPPGITLDERSGAIAGQPAQPGRFTFTLLLADAAGERAQRTYSLAVSAGLTIPACPTPVATAGQPYNSAVGVVGGQSPYTWRVTAGALPEGLALASDAVTGTPAGAGTSDFTIGVTDAGGGSATRSCSLAVAAQLRIATSALASAKLSGAYRQALTAEGGTAPYVWSVSDGTLAPGLTLNSATGEVIGVPSLAGTFRFTARVTDAAGVRAEQSYEVVVVAGLLISACPQPSAVLRELYSSGSSIGGAEGGITWRVSAGSLPAGLNLAADSGVITGIPEAEGSSEFTLTAADGKPDSATRTCSISVVPPALRVSGPDTLSEAVLGTSYEATVTAVGGRQPYRWTLAAGALPPGITVGVDGVVRGTPSAVGTYRFTLRVEDEDKAAGTRSFEMRVVAARAPLVSFADLPEILAPAQQPRVRLVLDSPYPAPLRGTLNLRFRPDPGLEDDPSIRFLTGDRSVDFQVAADSTDCVFSVPQMALQTGSVAGTIDLTVRLWSGDSDITPSSMPVRSVRIDRTAPVITNIRLNPVPNGVEVIVTGISTTREVTGATFQFTAAPGSRLDPSQVTIDTAGPSRQWFGDRRSVEFGGQFTFVQPFTVTGATLSELSVTLTNGQGTSQPVRARF